MIAATVGAIASASWAGESPAAMPRPVSSVMVWKIQASAIAWTLATAGASWS